ncbi:MAG: HAD family hydrolase [Lachnospiraceae bacterium]|nr:HAD family hydrolase [Lachnospiraceae bacterium]
MKMYNYILFDLDGTLTDPKLGITSCVQYALRKFGIEEPDRDKLAPFIGPPLLDSFREFYGFDEEKAQRAIAYYRERFSTIGLFENEVYPGIPQMLERLQKAGRHLAVASSKPTVFVTQILEHFGILSYFEVIVGSELDGTRTKKEEVVEEALRQLLSMTDKVNGIEETMDAEIADESEEQAGLHTMCAVQRQDIAMVGDRKYDIEGAKAYQIASIGVSYGYAAEGELEAAGADVIVETVEELGKVLSSFS